MEEQKKVLNEQADDEMEIDLVQLSVEFFRAAKKWWWLFVSLVVIGIAGLYGFYYARYSPLYRCEATFTVSTGENSSFYYSANAADQMSKTFSYVLDSGYFRSVLLEALGTEQLNGTISAETIENSNMVTMVVESPSAEDARSILEASLEVYPEVSRFVLGEIELHLIDEIQTPTAPYNQPSRRRIVLFGGLGGLLLASAVTLAAVLLNNTLKTTEDMERFSSLECLGALPDIKQKARKNSAASRYVSVLDPRTPHGFRESMGSLDIRLRAAMREREGARLEADIFPMRTSIADSKYDRPADPFICLIMDAASGMVINFEMTEPGESAELYLAEMIAGFILQYGKPKEIRISNRIVEAAIKNLCDAAGIKLRFRKTLRGVEDFKWGMHERM